MSVAVDYGAFLERKAQAGARSGFEPDWMPGALFDFQREMVALACRVGRFALFEDCGLGKGLQALAWAENVHRHTGRPVLIAAPLAVSQQFVREGEKIGVGVARSQDGRPAGPITATNYERLHRFDPADFAGVVCDESSAIKAMEGKRRAVVTEFLRTVPYRLLCTATPAPNDYHELGTSSEALGYLGAQDMLSRFFTNDLGSGDGGRGYLGARNQWRLKGHAAGPFWRWVASWARALRRPSDLGFPDGRFALPPLDVREHVLPTALNWSGQLWPKQADNLHEHRLESRATLRQRCEKAAALVAHGEPAVVWCHLNDEGDLLEKLIPDAKQACGARSDDENEETLTAFASGGLRVLVAKPVMFGWGLNLQRCARVVYFPTFSFEAYYQAVRRCWRFGQERPVTVDLVTSEGAGAVREALQRKAEQADTLSGEIVARMNDALAIDRGRAFPERARVPEWLSGVAS